MSASSERKDWAGRALSGMPEENRAIYESIIDRVSTDLAIEMEALNPTEERLESLVTMFLKEQGVTASIWDYLDVMKKGQELHRSGFDRLYPFEYLTHEIESLIGSMIASKSACHVFWYLGLLLDETANRLPKSSRGEPFDLDEAWDSMTVDDAFKKSLADFNKTINRVRDDDKQLKGDLAPFLESLAFHINEVVDLPPTKRGCSSNT